MSPNPPSQIIFNLTTDPPIRNELRVNYKSELSKIRELLLAGDKKEAERWGGSGMSDEEVMKLKLKEVFVMYDLHRTGEIGRWVI